VGEGGGVGTNLVLAAAEHTDNTETDSLDGERGGPVIGENREAYVTIAVDMRMYGDVWPQEYNLEINWPPYS